MMSQRSFSPRASASAKCIACFVVILPGQRRLVRIDDGLDDRRARMRERLRRTSLGVLRVLDREAGGAAGLGVGREVDRLQLDAELRVALEDHLLPLDLAEHVVLDDDDLHAAACTSRAWRSRPSAS